MDKTKKNYEGSPVEKDLINIETKDAMDKAYQHLFSDEDLLKKTQLTPNEIAKLNIIYSYAKIYDFPILVDLCENFMRMRVSLKRKGREEQVKISQSQLQREIEARQIQLQEDSKKFKRG